MSKQSLLGRLEPMSGSEYYIPKSHVQPCWYCSKACGRCSWSKDFTPIKGWVAEKVIVDKVIYEGKTYIVESYKILKCPELIDERKEYILLNLAKKPYEIAKDLKIGLIPAKRLIRQVKEELRNNEVII